MRPRLHAAGSLLAALVASTIGAAAGATPVQASFCPLSPAVPGVDVSQFQGPIEWSTVAGSGIGFSIARVTDGTYVDPLYAANDAGARLAGVRVGTYSFAEPSDDPVADADLFLSRADIRPGDLVPSLDLEVTGNLDPERLAAFVRAWLDEVQASIGVAPMIYTPPGWWNAHVGSTAFRSYPLWTANWGVGCPSIPWGWSGWSLWQYADNGSVPGIPATVDLDQSDPSKLAALTLGALPRVVFTAAQGVNLQTASTPPAFTLGRFSTRDGSVFTGAYDATIDWGDGTSGPGAVAASGTSLEVSGSHAYAADGSYRVRVILSDGTSMVALGYVPVTSSSRAVFRGPILLPASTEGSSTGPLSLGTFTMLDGSAMPADAAGTVDWGDGTTGDATVSIAGSSASVSAAHSYREFGYYIVAVTLADSQGRLGNGSTGENVFEAPITMSPVSTASEASFSGTVARFQDGNPFASPGDFSALVDWGDALPGAKSSGWQPAMVVAAPAGFAVQAAHDFQSLGPHTITVMVADGKLAPPTVSSSVLVYAFPAGGAFVVSAADAIPGSTATFWGASWAAANPLPGGPAPADFKGWEGSEPTPAPGDGWQAGPGTSARPPQALPVYMGVAVAGSVTRSGATISGDVAAIAVVQPRPGYSAALDPPGTGTVLAVFPGA